tara:strand:+ start:318 stop:467 length:150 start_codon:yes stop_codon:yes gene_type:complete
MVQVNLREEIMTVQQVLAAVVLLKQELQIQDLLCVDQLEVPVVLEQQVV